MKAPIKKVGRAPSKNDAATVALTKSNPEALIVERLQRLLAELDRLPLPIGKLGCQFLDALELCDQIRTKVREKAKELLLKKPDAIPGWSCERSAQRVLSKDTQAIFDALSGSLLIDANEFLAACSVSLSSLRKLIANNHNPHWGPAEIEHELNRVLANQIHYEMTARLARQLELSLEDERWDGNEVHPDPDDDAET